MAESIFLTSVAGRYTLSTYLIYLNLSPERPEHAHHGACYNAAEGHRKPRRRHGDKGRPPFGFPNDERWPPRAQPYQRSGGIKTVQAGARLPAPLEVSGECVIALTSIGRGSQGRRWRGSLLPSHPSAGNRGRMDARDQHRTLSLFSRSRSRPSQQSSARPQLQRIHKRPPRAVPAARGQSGTPKRQTATEAATAASPINKTAAPRP